MDRIVTVKTSGRNTNAEFVESENPILRLLFGQKVVTLSYSSVWPWITKMEAPIIKSKSGNESLAEEIQTMLQRLLGQVKQMKRPRNHKERSHSSCATGRIHTEPSTLVGQVWLTIHTSV